MDLEQALSRIAELEGHFTGLNRIIETTIKRTPPPNKLYVKGVEHVGPAVDTVYHMLRHTQKLCQKALYPNNPNIKMKGDYTMVSRKATLLEVGSFAQMAAAGIYSDTSGYYHPMKDGQYDPDVVLRTSEISFLPLDATHVAWFPQLDNVRPKG